MPATPYANFLRTLGGLFVWLVAAFFVGLALGRVSTALAVALAIFSALQLRRLAGVYSWLRQRRTREPPDYEGVWGETVAIISRLDRRKQFHKRRVVDLLREFR